MPAAEPSDTLTSLSPADLAVAELKALAGEGLNKGMFFDIVRATQIVSPDGGPWSTQKLNEALQRLIRKGVLSGDGVIHPAMRDPLTLRVAGRPGGRALAAAVRAAAPKSWRERNDYGWRRSWPYHDADLARAARLMVVADNPEEVERLISIAQAEAKADGRTLALAPLMLWDCPADPDFLAALRPSLRDQVAAAKVEMLIDEGVAAADLGAMIAAFDPAGGGDPAASPRLDRALLRLDILGERPAAARARLERVRLFDPMTAMAAEAALAFLTGPADASLPLFREALKRCRKLFGKRKIILPGEFGLFHLTALFAAADASLYPELSTLLDIATSQGTHWAAALECLLMLVSGLDQQAKLRASRLALLDPASRGWEGPLETAIRALALTVVDPASAAAGEGEDWRAVAAWGRAMPLAVRVLAEIHARPGGAVGHAEDWRTQLAALGPGYPRRFLDIVPIKPAWERALEKLEGFLAPPAPAAPKAETATSTRRLTFRLDADTLDIVAVEQATKGKSWTAGRPVALKRLHQRDPKLDYLTDDDQRVVRTVRLHRGYSGDTYEFDAIRGPLALVGHPQVYDADAPDRRIEVVAYPVELVVRETRDHIVIDLSHRAASPRVVLEVETPTRWRIIEVTPTLVSLAEVLGPGGLETPREARDRVIGLITTENPRLPVRSAMAGVTAEETAGEARPILQIVPAGEGFHIRAVVRPLGEAGSAYLPGFGSPSVLIPVEGGHRRVSRDLGAETAALEAVAEACPALEAWRDSDHDWRIGTLDATLEALQQLHAITPPQPLEWPEGARLAPTRTVGVSAVSLSIASAKDWFEVKGQVRVDEDLVFDMAEVLARLGDTPGRFVPLDDGRFLALTEDLRRRLDTFAAVTEAGKGGRRIGAAGAAAVEDLVEAAGSVKTDRRWSNLIERIRSARAYEPQPPAGLEAELRDYQLAGFAWLARLSRLELGACLADDMGLGKTVQTLALLLNDAAKGPSLVVAPTSVCHNWLLEAQRFAPSLRVAMLSAAPDRAALVESLGPGDVLVASYGLLHTESDLLASRRFAVAVFDEAQNLKNAETRRAQASKRIDAAFRLALSGTPIENRLEELWSLYDTVTPGLLGSRDSFQRRFAGPIERGQGGPARQALRSLLRPYLLRRTKAAVLAELPPRTEITLEIEPGPEERAFYEAVRRRALEALSDDAGAGGQKRMRILAEIMRLRRAACNPALIDPQTSVDSAKLAALLELTAELRASRHRALVFSQFTSHLDLAEAALRAAGVRLLRLDGSTPARERAKRVEAFQAGEGEMFLISLKAGGSGLNLTGADYVIHLDPWWNPAVEDQATDRAHRIGQTRPVTVYRLVVKDSIEEKILALHAAKRTLSADFLEDTDAAGALGEDELMALIQGL